MRGTLITGFGLVLLLVWAGCSRKTVVSSATEVKDSIYVKEVPRLVSYQVPPTKVMVKEFIKCDPVTNKPIPTKIESHSGRAKQTVVIDSTGLLTAEARCDSLFVQIQVMDKEIFRLRQEKSIITRAAVRLAEKRRKIDTFCRWFTGIGVIILFGYTFNKLKQFYP